MADQDQAALLHRGPFVTHFEHIVTDCALFVVGLGSKEVVLLLLTAPRFCSCSMFCCALFCIHSSFAIILIRKRELVALLSLSLWYFVIVVLLFLAVPQVCLQFVIVVFPDHTHYF